MKVHPSACANSLKPLSACECSCGGSQHGLGSARRQQVPRPGQTLPPVAGVPDLTAGQRVLNVLDVAERSTVDAVRDLLDVIIEIWRTGYGEVRDAFAGIPKNELSYGKTVKENMVLDLTANAREKYGAGTRVTGEYTVGVNRVHVSVVGTDGVTHKGFARAASDRLGCVHAQELTWDPPTVPTTAATPPAWALGLTGAAVTKVPRPATAPTKPATDWTAGMTGATVTTPTTRPTPTPAPAGPSWTEGMRH